MSIKIGGDRLAGKEEVKMPIMDALAGGPYPSYVDELKKSRFPLLLYEESLRLKKTQTGAGGYVSVPGVPSGLLVRATVRPEIAKDMNLIRVMPPYGLFYSTDAMRKICKIVDEEAIGLLHVHSNGNNLQILDIPKEKIAGIVKRVNEEAGFDVGSTGDDYRNPEECIGPARCDNALIDTIAIRQYFMSPEGYLDDVQYPRFPHKFKFKIAGCPNDCVRGSHKGDLSFVGVFRDAPKVDQKKLQEAVRKKEKKAELEQVVKRCPGGEGTMAWDGKKLKIDNDLCLHCMYCINKFPGVIRPGEDRGLAILIGAKSRGKYGPMLPKVLVPFIKVTPPKFREAFDIVDKLVNFWDEHAMKKERIGDFIWRIGFDRVMEACGVEPTSQQLKSPRDNAYYHWAPEELR